MITPFVSADDKSKKTAKIVTRTVVRTWMTRIISCDFENTMSRSVELTREIEQAGCVHFLLFYERDEHRVNLPAALKQTHLICVRDDINSGDYVPFVCAHRISLVITS